MMCSSINVASSAPTDVITKIATELSHPTSSWRRNLISMSHVCKSWREAVIRYPLLWNTIHNESEMVTRMCLKRSKSLPLAVSLSKVGHWSIHTGRLIGSQVGRFEELYLGGSLSSCQSVSKILSFLIPGEDPLLLRKLKLVGGKFDDIPRTHNLGYPILSKDIPTLRKLELSSFPLTQISRFRHLIELHVRYPGPTSAHSLLDLLANNPGPQRVGIIGLSNDRDSLREDLSIALPHLHNFYVDDCEAVDILRCLHLPRLEPLVISIKFSFMDVDLSRAYQPYSVIQLALDFNCAKSTSTSTQNSI